MNERRRDKRVQVDLPILVKVGKKPLQGTAVDVSFHGLRVKVDDVPPVRQLVHLDLALPTGKQFTGHAMVVHTGDGMIGLEFFGRSTNPDWDEFVHAQLRTGTTNPKAQAAPGVGTNPSVSVPPPMPPPIPPPRGRSPTGPQPPGLPGAGASGAPPGPAPHHPTPPPYNGPERRRAPRIHMKLELRLRTPRSIHTAHTVDVSMLGATLVVSDLSAQVGEPVIVNLIQPGTSFSFRRDGVLRRVSHVEGAWSHAGVEFGPLEPAREVLFAEFMNTAYATLKGG